MILKEKSSLSPTDKFGQAGYQAEMQMAFYLRRAFGELPDVYVFNDLRFGRVKGWLTPQNPQGSDYIFRYYLKPELLQGPYESWGRRRAPERMSEFPWHLLWMRMMGKEISAEEPTASRTD